MITILHNPRCRKSREGLAILEQSGKDFDIRLYLVDTLTIDELSDIIKKLNIKPKQLIRQNEAIWKSNFKGQDLNDKDIVQAMIDYPKLMERPIVIHNDKAVIGRPPETILDII